MDKATGKTAKRPAFTTWLRQQDKREDPVGDIARDTMRDTDWPTYARNHEAYQRYMMEQTVNWAILDSLDRALGEWAALPGVPVTVRSWRDILDEDEGYVGELE